MKNFTDYFVISKQINYANFFPTSILDRVFTYSVDNLTMSETFQAIIRDAQKGDASSIETIVAEFTKLIQQECMKYGLLQHPDWSHSDLSQEVLIHVLSQIRQFRGTDTDDPRAAFEQWLRVTTKNFLSNLQRRRKAKKRFPETGFKNNDGSGQPNHDLQDHAKTASSIFFHKEDFERLHNAIQNCLDGTEQEILMLRAVEGLTLKEISERLQLTYDQVRYKYETSLSQVQRHLK